MVRISARNRNHAPGRGSVKESNLATGIIIGFWFFGSVPLSVSGQVFLLYFGASISTNLCKPVEIPIAYS